MGKNLTNGSSSIPKLIIYATVMAKGRVMETLSLSS